MGRMKIYADAPARRSRQIVGDVTVAVWVVLWVRLAVAVREATLTLTAPGEQLESAGSGLAGKLRDAGAAVDNVPLVGDQVRAPFDGAGDAAAGIAAAGTAQVEAVHVLAFWLSLTVGGIPILVVVAAYLSLRWRFVREATAGQRYLDAGGDVSLFALRAMSRQPLRRLRRISGDPVRAWQDGDAHVVRELAVLELTGLGLAPPAVPRSTLAP